MNSFTDRISIYLHSQYNIFFFRIVETHIGDKVSIYADLKKKCKKGLQKLYTDEGKLFIGNGTAKMQRHHLFADKAIPRYTLL